MTDTTKSAFNDPSLAEGPILLEPGMESQFLEMLLRNLDVGIGILDKDMSYRVLSNATYHQMHLEDGDIKLGDPLSRMHEIMTEKGLLTAEMMEEQNLSEAQHRVYVQDGTKMESRLVKLGDGRTQKFCRKVMDNGYTLSVATDVTELVEKDQLLEASLTLGMSGIWIYDFKTKSYSITQSLRSYFGEALADKVVKGGIHHAIAPEHRHKVKECFQNIAKTGDKFEADLKAITRTGKHRWSHTTAELERDKQGRPIRLRAFVRDMDREYRQQEAIEAAKDEAIQASKAKSEFLANMSHEIRTPMNGILGMAELLAMSDIDERQREYVNVITNSAGALLCIINDILDFSKIEAGALTLDPTPFDLKTSVNDVTSLLIANAQEKGLELIINYPSSLPVHFISDAGRLRQIVTNLVGNAIKFTAEGHIQIDVDVTESDLPDISNVTINVTDTGIGIPPESIYTIFDKFTQADGSTTRVYGGTGLGLAITKRICEMMGGTIDLTSTVGEGSTFSVKVPLKRDFNAQTEQFDVGALTGKHALIVDDIEVNQTILKDQLMGWGMTSTIVSNGVEAAEALKTSAKGATPSYDVILLDYLMPGVNGRELAAMLSKQSQMQVPPIVMLSSCDQSVSSQELAEIGIQTYLIKPVRERRLFDTLGRLFSQKARPATQTPAIATEEPRSAPQITETPTEAVQSEAPTPPAETPSEAYQPVQLVTQTDAVDASQDSPPSDSNTANDDHLLDSLLADVAAKAQSNVSKPQPETVTAPAAQAQQTPPTPSVSTEPAPTAQITGSGKQEILVAEDFPLNRDVVRLMLVESKFEPVFAENGKLASELYIAESERFPVILMDVSMPVMDGYQATHAIRDWEKVQGRDANPVPIIALTGHALKNDRQACLDAGMSHYLTKPVKQGELLDILEQYLGQVNEGRSSQAA